MKIRSQWNRIHRELGASPLINWLLGGLILLLFVSGTVVQIQTSEYLAMGNPTRVASVAWGVLFQPWLLITGQAPTPQEATAWQYAWTVEVITLVFGLSLSVAIVKIRAANPVLVRWFVLGSVLLIALNSWADYSSSPGVNPLVQALIAIAIGGIVVVGLPLGLGLIEHGFSQFAASAIEVGEEY